MRGACGGCSQCATGNNQCGSLGREVSEGVYLLTTCFAFYFSFLYSQRTLTLDIAQRKQCWLMELDKEERVQKYLSEVI